MTNTVLEKWTGQCFETKLNFPISSQAFTAHQTTLVFTACYSTINQKLKSMKQSMFSALNYSIPL